MTRQLVLATVLLGLVGAQSPPQPRPPRIIMDGDFGDWDQVPVAVHDPADAPTSIIDFGEVRVTADEGSIYVLADFGRSVNLQALPAGTVSLLVDEDSDAATGQIVHGMTGIDFTFDLGQREAVRRYQAGAAQPIAVEPATSGFLFAPRFAASRHEFRVDRGAARRATAKLVFHQGATILDETESMPVVLPAKAVPGAPGPNERVPQIDPLRRADGTALRVAIWNVTGFRKSERGYRLRILRAIDADILMLDEWGRRKSAREFEQWLSEMDAGERAQWHVVVDDAFQGTAVAARGQVHSAFSHVAYPADGLEAIVAPFAPDARAMVRAFLQEGVGTTGVLATVGGRRILSAPVDMTCCGGQESSNDAERRLEAQAIATAARRALAGAKADAVFIGGDLNLVGSRDPLDVLLGDGLDPDGSSLRVADALTLDGRSNMTERAYSFTDGHLDWLLYSDSSLIQVGGFVLDTATLSPYWLAQHHLLANDSEKASDHLPVVADFRWRR
jgi:exonuclease III